MEAGDEKAAEKVLIFEVVIPNMNIEEIQAADSGDVPLQFVLGHVSNEVVIVFQGNPTDEDGVPQIGSYTGLVTRAHLADPEWVQMTADATLRPPPPGGEE